jgi:hypothetical protein
MKIGTKSVLFGAHQFAIHPWFVALAWWKLYGFPWDPRLWVAFFVHDLGYIGKPNMDGPEGEAHPEFGAAAMSLFDRKPYTYEWYEWPHGGLGVPWRMGGDTTDKFSAMLCAGWEVVDIANTFTLLRLPRYRWSDFCLFHSRYYSKKVGAKPSQLCFADKLAFNLTPRWLYLPMVRATGELNEYLKNAQKADRANWKPTGMDAKMWHNQLCSYMQKWVDAHKDGAEDTWTSANRNAVTASGVWQ